MLDLVEIPFVPNDKLRQTAIDRIRYNEDHSLIAVTIDIGNNEILTAGIKDMKKNEVVNLRLDKVSQVESFGKDGSADAS